MARAVSVFPGWLESVAGEEMKEAEEWRAVLWPGWWLVAHCAGLCHRPAPDTACLLPGNRRGEGWGALYRSDFYPVESVRGAWSWS